MRPHYRALSAIAVGTLCILRAGPLFAQDAAAGILVFAQCSVCHSTDGTNGVGPTLQGIVGRKAGTVAGFRYSRAMKAANITWDDKLLDDYLADPQKLVPGNVMPFSGLAEVKQRLDVIAYLKTLK